MRASFNTGAHCLSNCQLIYAHIPECIALTFSHAWLNTHRKTPTLLRFSFDQITYYPSLVTYFVFTIHIFHWLSQLLFAFDMIGGTEKWFLSRSLAVTEQIRTRQMSLFVHHCDKWWLQLMITAKRVRQEQNRYSNFELLWQPNDNSLWRAIVSVARNAGSINFSNIISFFPSFSPISITFLWQY